MITFYVPENKKINELLTDIRKFDNNQRLSQLTNKILEIKDEGIESNISKNTKTNYETISFSIDTSTKNRLNIFIEKLHINNSLLLRYIIYEFMEQHFDILLSEN